MFPVSVRFLLSFTRPLQYMLAVVLGLTFASFTHADGSSDGLPATSSRVIYGAQNSDQRLVIGSVTNSPRYNFGQMQKLSLYMLEALEDHGIEAVMVVTIESHDQLVRLMREGHVDWVSATPYAALLYEQGADAEIVLTKKSRGRRYYRTVFFSRSDSGISSLEDLKGKTIAFEKPGSTSAYFLPAMELLGAGLKLTRLESPRDTPPEDGVGYVFSGDEVNSSTWVHKRISDAAAFSDEDWTSEWRTPVAFRDELAIFHTTRQVPRSLEILRPGMDPLLRTHIVNSLLALNSHPDGEEILQGYYTGSEFAKISDEQEKVLDSIRAIMETFEMTMNGAEKAVAAVPTK